MSEPYQYLPPLTDDERAALVLLALPTWVLLASSHHLSQARELALTGATTAMEQTA